jgi:hypothetical protein
MAIMKQADAEFGKALVTAAREEWQEAQKKAVVGQVTKLMGDIKRCEDTIERLEQGVKVAQRKLEAIEKGEFHVVGTAIQYTDRALNGGMGTEEIVRLASTYL